MNWIESPETKDRYWSLNDEDRRFSIISLSNSFELSYDFRFDGVQIRTTHRSHSCDSLKLLAESIVENGYAAISKNNNLLTM